MTKSKIPDGPKKGPIDRIPTHRTRAKEPTDRQGSPDAIPTHPSNSIHETGFINADPRPENLAFDHADTARRGLQARVKKMGDRNASTVSTHDDGSLQTYKVPDFITDDHPLIQLWADVANRQDMTARALTQRRPLTRESLENEAKILQQACHHLSLAAAAITQGNQSEARYQILTAETYYYTRSEGQRSALEYAKTLPHGMTKAKWANAVEKGITLLEAAMTQPKTQKDSFTYRITADVSPGSMLHIYQRDFAEEIKFLENMKKALVKIKKQINPTDEVRQMYIKIYLPHMLSMCKTAREGLEVLELFFEPFFELFFKLEKTPDLKSDFAELENLIEKMDKKASAKDWLDKAKKSWELGSKDDISDTKAHLGRLKNLAHSETANYAESKVESILEKIRIWEGRIRR